MQLLGKLALAAISLFPGMTFSKAATGGEQSEARPIPFAQHYARLYRIGTGILGWPADLVWSSTPAEILEAFHGYNGAIDDAPDATADTKLDRDGLNKLRGLGRLR